ncbi:MAG: glycosyltransferase family 2 protein [Acidobacteria bacterium]|nr:glycosyltransferase family 2 protein [Acidobacteriota bacterium]
MASEQYTVVPLELAVIIPTFNEAANVEPLLKRLAEALQGVEYETIFVDDDSVDGTAELVRKAGLGDRKVRIIHRVGRKGLASACLEGMMSTAAPYVAVIDGDQQHDETILPKMLEEARRGKLDLVVGTRNAQGGSMGEFSRGRVLLSRAGARLSRWIAKVSLSDPMSGYFLVDRTWLNEVIHLTSAVGFKVLLDLVASSPRRPKIAEVPYTFRNRQHGESKLDVLVGLEYFQLLVDKVIGHIIPVRFVLFSLVGLVGMFVALGLLYFCTQVMQLPLNYSHVWVTVVVMVLNFYLNNALTYRSQRLRGWAVWIGLGSFMAACSIGIWLNLQARGSAEAGGLPWYAASGVGLLVGGCWNYFAAGVFTWKRQQVQLFKRTMRVIGARGGT